MHRMSHGNVANCSKEILGKQSASSRMSIDLCMETDVDYYIISCGVFSIDAEKVWQDPCSKR